MVSDRCGDSQKAGQAIGDQLTVYCKVFAIMLANASRIEATDGADLGVNRMVNLVQIDPQKILVILCALRPLVTRYSPLMRT